MAGEDLHTLSELFLDAVTRRQQPEAFLVKASGRYRGVSSQEALERVGGLAAGLERLGVERGDRVAIMSDNRLEWALSDYAALSLGASVVPVYPTLLEPDVQFILGDSEARGIVVSTHEQLEKIVRVRPYLPRLAFVLVMEPVEKTDGVRSWQDAAGTGPPGGAANFLRERAARTQPHDTASIIYTSGTTGQYKGVVLTHANLVSNILSCQTLFRLGQHDVAISFLPLSHVFERMLDYYYFHQGVTIAYAESFETLPQNLLEVRPTVMAVVPRVLEKIHEKVQEAVRQASPGRRKMFNWALDVGQRYFPCRLEGRAAPLGLRLQRALANRLVYSQVQARLGGRVNILISGAAPLARELGEFFYAMGLPVYEGYGLTETSPVISVNFPGCVKLGTVGRVIPGVEVKLDEPEVSDDGSGREILVRGPNVMPGYYHLEEENQRAFTDGWFHTGDLGALDEDGFLSITGRKKNLFKTAGGKFVSPEKLENLFQGHPYVAQVMVVGDRRRFVSALIVPHFSRLERYAQEQGIAFAEREGLLADRRVLDFFEQQLEELMRWLPRHEKIKQFALLGREFTIAAGELSPTQKVRRGVVEKRYARVIEELYQRHEPAPRPGS